MNIAALPVTSNEAPTKGGFFILVNTSKSLDTLTLPTLSMHNETPLEPSRGADNTGQVVTDIFASMRESQIDFLVLRNYEALPDVVGNDLDLLVRASDRSRAEKAIVSAVLPHGYQLHDRREYSCVSLFLSQPDSTDQLHVDVFTRLEWRGFRILSTKTVLEDRVPGELFDTPTPIHEGVVNLLTRLLYSGYVKDEYKPGIFSSFSDDPKEASRLLSDAFGTALSAHVVESVLGGEWSTIEAMANRLRFSVVVRSLANSPIETSRALLRDALRLTRRAL